MLHETLKNARRSILRNYTPLQYITYTNNTVTLPLNTTESRDLYNDLEAHFRSWTGQSFETYRRNSS
jgi:hypothetical protein